MDAPVVSASLPTTTPSLVDARPVACHAVQVSYDDAVFSQRGEEPRERQRLYARLLREKAPGSYLTLLVLTRQPSVQRIDEEGLSFIPVAQRTSGARGRLEWWRGLRAALLDLHRARPIGVLAPQALNEEAWVAYLFARQHAVPMVGQIHFDPFSAFGRSDNYGQGAVGALRGALSRALVPRMDAVRTVGRAVAQRLEMSRVATKVLTIPVPVAMVAQSAGMGADVIEPLVLFVGRLCAAKNLDAWIEVARRVAPRFPSVGFEIVGDGELRERLALQAASAGIGDRVCFRGFVPYHRLSDLYRRSAVFLMTSHYEGFGRVLVEAAANGLPAVAPRISGVEDIVIDGETGYLVRPGAVDEYAARLISILGDAALRRRLGAAAALRARSAFDPQTLAERWVSLLLDVAIRNGAVPC